MVTGGDDGFIETYYLDERCRTFSFLKTYKMNPCTLLPITSIDFSHDGTIMGYSSSYNWSKGYQNDYDKNISRKTTIFLHSIDIKLFSYPKCY